MFTSSFWPALFAFAGVTIAMLVLIDFVTYVGSRYKERYLQEASTELNDILLQIPAGRILDLSVAISIFGSIIAAGTFVLSVRDTQWGYVLLVALIVMVVLFPIPRIILKQLKKRRLHMFNLQLEDALGMISGALKAGFSITQAIETVAELKTHPVSVEFKLLLQETQLGVPLDQALENMSKRLESDDFELVATAITTARETGGELTSTLERVAALIRERVKIAQKVKALTSMGRLQAIMIGLMPLFLLFALSKISPQMMDSFLHSAVGIIALAVVLVLDIIGFLVIKKITTIEV